MLGWRESTGKLGAILLAALVLVAVWVVLRAARREREDPARCPAGLVAQGSRCCGEGQHIGPDGCSGRPSRCAPDMTVVDEPATGCVAPEARAEIAGGTLRLSPSDWEAAGEVSARTLVVRAFSLDTTEVTALRWRRCVTLGRCAPRADTEPGLPVTQVSAAEAERFCQTAGGRLPTRDEWLFAAAGGKGRRYPWGQTGLVCRRAAFGLVAGPCAQGATGPELAGARPDGRSEDGLHDLAGNVAEWAREPDGSFRAYGGSYRSRLAGELKTWSVEAPEGGDRAAHIGFRCAYERRD